MIEVVIFSLVIIGFSVLGIVWDFATGLITSGVDGVLLLGICLLMGGLFALQLVMLARKRHAGGGK